MSLVLRMYSVSDIHMKKNYSNSLYNGGRCGRDLWWLDLQLHMQSVPITTKVVSSNPDTTFCDKVCQ